MAESLATSSAATSSRLRRRDVLAAMAVVAAGAGLATGCRSEAAEATSEPLSQAPDRRQIPVGFALGSEVLWATDADLAKIMDTVLDVGAAMVRFDIAWTFAEPSAGQLDWGPSDRVVEAASSRGLEVLATVTNSPAWAAVGNVRHTGRPAEPARYAEFAGRVAQHYHGRVGRYEIWNEPNGRMFFQPDPDPSIYASMLRQAYTAIKGVDSAAIVVAGALGATGHGDGVITPLDYLEQMYEAGGGGSFDALSYHPYDYGGPFAAGAVYTESPMQQIVAMYQLMAANGDGDKQIWITEYGAPSTVLGEDVQSTLIVESLRQWPEVGCAGPFFIYGLRDDGVEVNDPHAGFGVVTADFQPKRAFAAVKAVLAKDNPVRPEYEQFFAEPDASLGLALTPVFPLADGLAQQFVRGTRFKTSKGFFNSPSEVAALAQKWRIVPISPFANGYQDFAMQDGGRIFTSEATGTHLIFGAILTSWRKSMGFPVSDQYAIGDPASPGGAVDFERGRITWSPNAGINVVTW